MADLTHVLHAKAIDLGQARDPRHHGGGQRPSDDRAVARASRHGADVPRDALDAGRSGQPGVRPAGPERGARGADPLCRVHRSRRRVRARRQAPGDDGARPDDAPRDRVVDRRPSQSGAWLSILRRRDRVAGPGLVGGGGARVRGAARRRAEAHLLSHRRRRVARRTDLGSDGFLRRSPPRRGGRHLQLQHAGPERLCLAGAGLGASRGEGGGVRRADRNHRRSRSGGDRTRAPHRGGFSGRSR